MSKTIEIYGKTFELEKTVEYDEIIRINTRDIYDCYDNPSQAKLSIWKHWRDWFVTNNSTNFGVSGYNCMQFTISGIVRYNGVHYYLYITKCHNRARRII